MRGKRSKGREPDLRSSKSYSQVRSEDILLACCKQEQAVPVDNTTTGKEIHQYMPTRA